jgi:hypothetical protein
MIWVSVIELLYFLIPWILIFCFLHLLFKVVVNITFAPKKSSTLHFYLLIFVHQLFRHWYLVGVFKKTDQPIKPKKPRKN